MQRRGSGAAGAERQHNIQEKMNFEIRIREGIRKLLTVSTQKDQLLQAVKNLMVCNARIHAYRTELQNQMEGPVSCRTGKWLSGAGTKDRMACRGKVALSDIRIPLMWKGSDHFNNKEKSQRYAVFCLFRMGAEVFDTEVAIVDKAITDICFENVTIFDEAGPDFQVKVEVYSCCTEETLYVANTPKKLVKKLKTSLSKATGKKLKATLEEDGTDSILLSDPVIHGAKYSLLAYTTLGLESAKDSFRTHNLTITGNEESSFWLPLYGNMCCRLVAQPSCMARDMMTGFLNQQQMIGNLTSWRRLYCVLRGGKLSCYHSPEEIEAKVEPALRVSINKETRIQSVDKDSKRRTNSFSVITPLPGEAATQLFATDSREELQKWMEAFWQHFYDLSFGMVPLATRAFAHVATVPSIHANTHCLLETGDSSNMMQVSGSKKSLKTNVLGKLGMIGQWKHCCEELMKIEIMSPRKPPLFLTKEATSVYHDMNWNCEDAQNAVWVIELLCIRAASSHNTTSAVNAEREGSKSAIQKFHEGIDSPVKHEGLADITQRKIEESDGEFLLCQQKEPASSLWASLFDGSHEMVVQKNMHTASPNDGRGKKRRAPPPPSDKPAYNAKARGNAEERDKENWERPDGTSCSSLDSVLSMETQQLQAPAAAPRRICPCRKNSLADHRNPVSLVTKTESETKPVPTPRQKCITQVLDPRSRLQPQT